MKIAVCTSNGSDVDLHFGKTEVFHIYEVAGGEKKLLTKRIVDAYSPAEEFLNESDNTHPFNEEKFQLTLAAINDCQKLYTVDIGQLPAEKLAEEGITVQKCSCPVDMIPTCSGRCKHQTR